MLRLSMYFLGGIGNIENYNLKVLRFLFIIYIYITC